MTGKTRLREEDAEREGAEPEKGGGSSHAREPIPEGCQAASVAGALDARLIQTRPCRLEKRVLHSRMAVHKGRE